MARGRRVLKASGAALAQRVAQFLTTLVTIPLVVRDLGVADFGVWGAATSIAWLSGVLDLGFGGALITLIPAALAENRICKAREHVAAALFTCSSIGALILGGSLVFLLATPQSQKTALMLVPLAGVALNVPLSVSSSLWYGLQKGEAAACWELVQTLILLALLLAGVATHAGVLTMVAAVYAAPVLTNAASLLHVLSGHPEVRPSGVPPPPGSLAALAGTGGMLFLVTICAASSYAFDSLLALRWVGPVASAQVTIVMRVCTTIAGILAVISQPIWPAFVEAHAKGDRRWVLRALSLGTLTMTLGAFGAAAVLIAAGGGILRWWLHVDIGAGAGLMWAAGVWIVVLCIPRVVGLLFNAVAILRFQVIVAIAALVLSLTLKWAWSTAFGAIGIILATPVSWLVVVWPTFLWRLRRWHAIPLAARIADPPGV